MGRASGGATPGAAGLTQPYTCRGKGREPAGIQKQGVPWGGVSQEELRPSWGHSQLSGPHGGGQRVHISPPSSLLHPFPALSPARSPGCPLIQHVWSASVSVEATLSGLLTTETYFHSLVAGSQGSAWSILFWVRLPASHCTLTWWRERELVSSYPYEGTDPIMSAPPSWLLPKVPPLNVD